jgi:glycosyltransferase involved in cell wall biosynthesis
MDNQPVDLVFVIPFRNEERHIQATLDSLGMQDLDGFSAEVILVNGMSTDHSRQLVENFIQNTRIENLRFSLRDNPALNTPTAYNIGINQSTASIIGFGGAHTTYPSNYLRTAIKLLRNVDADVVGGGHDKIISFDRDVLSQAISCLYMSPMGAGVAAYHRLKLPGYVDTVYGGLYKREVFDRVGLFSESLSRNQDNELNARVVKAGFKIYFHPDLSTTYIQKTDLNSFLKRAYNFGFYHPATWKANPHSFRLRHFIPSVWVLYLVGLLLPSLFFPEFLLWLLLPLFLYVVLLGLSSVNFMISRSFYVGLATFPLFAVYHLSYGVGTFVGFIDIFFIRHQDKI